MTEEYVLARPATLEKLHEWATSDVVPEPLFVRLEDRKQQIREALEEAFTRGKQIGREAALMKMILPDDYTEVRDLVDALVELVYGEKQ